MTNVLLHLPDGPAADDRDHAMAHLPRDLARSTGTTSVPHCTAGPRAHRPLAGGEVPGYRWTRCPGSSFTGIRSGWSGASGVLPRMRSAAFSAIIIVAAWVALFGQ
jgi:hypothetical protein